MKAIEHRGAMSALEHRGAMSAVKHREAPRPRALAAAPAAARPHYLLLAALLGLALLAAAPVRAQELSEEDLFGEETLTEALGAEAAPQEEFLTFDGVRIGGSVTGSAGFSATWKDPWGGEAKLLEPDSRALSPALSGKITMVAKPSVDFGVNADLRTSWPFSSNVEVEGKTYAIPKISIWSLYSKFSWKDSLFFTFGKQPLAWGVAKGYFQPADDIFSLSAVSLDDTGAEREGPVSLKLHYPVPRTMANFYLFAGVPDQAEIDLEDARLAVKGEISLGNAEIGAGAYYSYDDHPRGLLMATFGTGDFNFYGEAVLKYGSERYFLAKSGSLPYPLNMSSAQREDRFYLNGTVGLIYQNSDWNLTATAQYFHNGEYQEGVTAEEAFGYFMINTDKIDRAAFERHYAFASLSKSELLLEDLSAGLVAVANLSDLSALLMPSISYRLFDYMSLKLGATFALGEEGDEYTMQFGGTQGASLSLSLSLGSGSF